MGQFIWYGILALLLHADASPSPLADQHFFLRSAVETIPQHEPIPLPIRASVESTPLRSIRDERDQRLPLRDAVEKRPISLKTANSFLPYEETNEHDVEDLRGSTRFYGAASHLNNVSTNAERLHHGNANLQEMQQTSWARRLVICYMQSWAAYRAPPLAFTAGLIPKSCTHLHYAFAVIHPHTYAVIPANEDYDIIKGGYRIATGLKRRFPGLRVMISIGGDGTDRLFSEMVQSQQGRYKFLESAVNFLREHDFDGLDLHWVYPGEKDDREKDLLTSLLYELREKFSSEGFLLSTVLPPFRYQIEDGYDLSAVSGAADYVILQAWDMTHGKRDEVPSRAVQHSALHRDPGAASRDQRYDNIEFMVKYITKHGMAAEKLVLGVPLFGRSYTLALAASPAPGAHVVAWGEEGQYTQTRGMLAYFEICMAERESKGKTNVDDAGNSYAVFEDQWITYDTPKTVLEKMRFIKLSGLAGAAAWSVDMDDFRGLCGSPFPILSAIATGLNGETIPDQSTLKIGSCESSTPYLSSDEESCAHFHFCSGGISYRIMCEEDRLYNPSTGFCGHQDPTKCIPGQSLRISVSDAARFLSQVYEIDFVLSLEKQKESLTTGQSTSAAILEKKITLPKHNRSRGRRAERTHEQAEDLKEGNMNGNHFVNIEKRQTWSWQYEGVQKTSTTAAPKVRRRNYYKTASKDNDKKVVCYMTSWAFYRRGDGKFVPEHIDSRLCTHIVYAYASLSPNDLVAKEFDPWTDLTNNLYERVTSLRDVNVLLGLGGWTDSVGDKYSRLVSSASARAKFIEKLIVFLRKHNFNGLHLDWNYPVCWQSNCKKGAASDKRNFGLFVQELSKALHENDMELGVAISGYKEVIDVAYDFPTISNAADFMSVMTYDYHGGWERRTAHHTPLVPPPNDPLAHYSIEYAIKSIISKGADPKKLLLGLSFYGQSYRLADVEAGSRPGAPAAGPGEPGEFTKQPGMLSYYEICYRVKDLRWKTGRQDNAGPYAYSDSQWVGYDDPKSIKEKVEWAMRQGLGGVMAWAIDLDDFNNHCCTEPSPLLRAAGRALGRPVPAPPTTACERPPQPVTPAPPTTTTVESDGSMGGSTVAGIHDHHHHTSTTWPSWNPSPTTPSTTQTWWPVASTTTPTTTTTTTTKRTTTTTKRPTTQPPQQDTGIIEGSSCRAGEYNAAPSDCGGYLQCEGGQWRKQLCAPGLHWAAAVNRCDWPSFAKCTEKPTNEASTATTTLAPMTSRPPQTTSTTTTTRRPTPRPTTTTTTTLSPTSSGPREGGPCSGDGYHAASDCNAYLHCDGHSWRLQHCAPGLHWSAKEKQCDWPKYAKCQGTTPKPTIATPRPTRPTRPSTSAVIPSGDRPEEDQECSSSDSHAPASSCESYLLCVGGRWKKQRCPPGLHWDKRTSRCDWIEFAMCEGSKPAATKSTMRPTTYTTTTRRPTTVTTKKPIEIEETHKPAAGCMTGTYHAHPKCEKFYVCVNGVLVAQSCAPGLVWRPDRTQCDFPGSTTCTDRRQILSAAMVAMVDKPDIVMENNEPQESCVNGEYSMDPSDCSRYRHCLFGKYEEFSCIKGLHWNQEKRICDWPNNSKCTKVQTSPKPVAFDPLPEIPHKPIHHVDDNAHKPSQGTSPNANMKPDLLDSRYKLVCYYTNWSWYRPGIGSYVPEDIDRTLCTHIVYGFAVLGSDGLITAHDSWADYDNDFYKRVVAYKRYGIKVSLAIGGWNDSAGDKYSKLVNDPSARASFVSHVVRFIEQYGFDGLDLDWEYPKCWQVDCSKGPDSDKESFADFVQELSAALKPKGLLLSSAVSPNKLVIDAAYDVPILAKYLDWIAVMTYDYHGQWDKKTGHVAPLYYHPDDDTTYFNANYTIHYWMKKGAPPSKIVMGMPLYGQTFTTGTQWDTAPDLVARMNATGLNIPAVSGGEAGEYTRAKGFLAYYEICEQINHNGWKVIKDPYQRMGPYAYKGDQWVSFDDVDILKKKVNFIKSMNLAGGMVWALDLDDFRNRCGQGKHPLMNAIKNGLLDPRIEPETVQLQPIAEPPNILDDDLEDIEVRPGSKPTAAPMKPTVQMDSIVTTTKKPTTAVVMKEERYKVICYYTAWSWYRPSGGKFTPSDVDPSLCSHVVYAFAALDADDLVMKPHDIWLDVENKFYQRLVSLKARGIRVLLSLGGWDDSVTDKYSRLVNNESARRRFVVHVVDFLEQYEFDGLDLDWEYPKCWQGMCNKGPSSDKEGFAELIKDLRSAFNSRGLLLSAAVSANQRIVDVAYDIPTLSANLDWIALMTYDYHGHWENKTGHLAPMYAHERDEDSSLNANFTVHYWIKQGADRQKLIMGLPLYGQSFSLDSTDFSNMGLGAMSFAGGNAGDETRARGFLSFYEICDRIKVEGWRVVRDPGGRMGPYATLDDQWVSFDDDFMVRHKAEYIRAMGLGGGMAWALDLDDFKGQHCGCGKSPLLANINFVLRGREQPPPCALEPPQDTGTLAKPSATAAKPQQDEESKVTASDETECSGGFKPHETDCSKYYFCINGMYMELSCAPPSVWNKVRCDVPENTQCKSRKTHLSLRLHEETAKKPILACYFTNWAYYRKAEGKFGPEQVDPTMCTHIVYAWARLNSTSNTIIPGIPEVDVNNDFFGKLTGFKQKGVKVIIGIGGLEDSDDEKWNELARSSKNRKNFVNSALKFLRRWNFDGLQLAWQYPGCNQVPCNDFDIAAKESFSYLLTDLSKALTPHGYELSAMVSSTPEIAFLSYEPEILSATLDWIAIAANDYYASTTGQTAYLVPLETSEMAGINSFNASLAYWASIVPEKMLVMGVPAYARSYTLRSLERTGVGAPVAGPGRPGPSTAVPGFLAYYEVCEGIKSGFWKESRTEDGTYAVRDSQWASYLRAEEAYRVGASAGRAGLRGAALWALDLDDWTGRCGCGPQPLLSALRQGLHEPTIPPLICLQ